MDFLQGNYTAGSVWLITNHQFWRKRSKPKITVLLRQTGVGSLNCFALFNTWMGHAFATSSGKMTCLLKRRVIENFPQFWRANRAQGPLMCSLSFDCIHVGDGGEGERESLKLPSTRFMECASDWEQWSVKLDGNMNAPHNQIISLK